MRYGHSFVDEKALTSKKNVAKRFAVVGIYRRPAAVPCTLNSINARRAIGKPSEAAIAVARMCNGWRHVDARSAGEEVAGEGLLRRDVVSFD